MSSKDYWRKREDEALKHYIKDEKEYDKEIQRIYSDMLDACNKEINAFYGKYADKEGITLAEAKKRVRELDIKEYERKAARYVKDKDFSAQANEEMRIYNLTMKVNRLEMLKANIGLETIKGHDELEKFMSGILKGRTEEELARQAGILGKTIRNNAKLAHTIPNASFHNATFSDRIWQYQDLMREDLSKILSSALIQGKNPRAVAKELQKYWYGNDPRTGGGAVYCMERLMRTELARVQTEAQKQSFIRNGFEEYEFIANSGCCDICKNLDGKHFKVSKMMPGENASPMHPHCRCSTAAYSDRKEYDEWLDFLEKGGTTAEFEKLKAKGTKIPFTPKKAEKQAEKQPQAQADGFTKGQEKALEEYVSGEGQWINQYLRGRGDFGELSEAELKMLKDLEGATDKQLPSNVKKLYRSVDATAIFGDMSDIDFENLENAILYNSKDKFSTAAKQKYLSDINGKSITEKGFMSTTKSLDVAEEWGGFTGSNKPVVIEFDDIPKGLRGADLRKFDVDGDEQFEVLLARNTKYEIVDVFGKDGQIHIKARFIVDDIPDVANVGQKQKTTTTNNGSYNTTKIKGQYKMTEPLNEYDYFLEEQESFRLSTIKEMSGADNETAEKYLDVLCGKRDSYVRSANAGTEYQESWFYGADNKIRLATEGEYYNKAKVIDDYIEKSPKYDGTIYRGLSLDDDTISQFKEGAIFKENGNLSSWTSEEDVALMFAEGRSEELGKKPVIFETSNHPYSTPTSHLSIFGSEESEVLVSNMKKDEYIIDSVTEKDGCTYVKMKLRGAE